MLTLFKESQLEFVNCVIHNEDIESKLLFDNTMHKSRSLLIMFPECIIDMIILYLNNTIVIPYELKLKKKCNYELEIEYKESKFSTGYYYFNIDPIMRFSPGIMFSSSFEYLNSYMKCNYNIDAYFHDVGYDGHMNSHLEYSKSNTKLIMIIHSLYMIIRKIRKN